MSGLIRSLLLFLLFFIQEGIFSQDVSRISDRIYGPDPLLFNGKKYTYFMPAGTGGNPFFRSSEFSTGEITIRGEVFSGLLINYDIFNQKLLLQYRSEAGTPEIIEVSEAWLQKFSLGRIHFLYLDGDELSGIFQVLGEGRYRILYRWRKTLRLSNSAGAAGYSFSAPIKERYVLADGQISPFGSKSKFVDFFPPEKRNDIRKYLQSGGLNVKKASDEVMTLLMNYINNLE